MTTVEDFASTHLSSSLGSNVRVRRIRRKKGSSPEGRGDEGPPKDKDDMRDRWQPFRSIRP